MGRLSEIKVETIPEIPSVHVLHMKGEVDESNVTDMIQVMDPLVHDPDLKILIVDCDGLDYISSKAVGQFAAAYSTLNRNEKSIALASLGQTLFDIINLVGLNKLIPIYPSLDEAITDAKTTLQEPSNEISA
jgi:anti-anti-sigma factor